VPVIAWSRVSDLKDKAKRAYIDHNNARSDHERQMTREIYDLRHAELSQAEETLNRLDSNLALHGIGGEDQITQSLAYLENFDRLLQQLPADQLRRTFSALGVRIDIQFAPNTVKKSRRQRVPIGGTLTFGAKGVGLGAGGNDSPPAVAGGDASSDATWLGCGGSYVTQILSRPTAANTILARVAITWSQITMGNVVITVS
jgi:hypothetical protein